MRKGDRISIIDDGKVYSTYTKMAEFLGATKWENKPVQQLRGVEGTIVSAGVHLQNKRSVILLVDTGPDEILIGIEGVRNLDLNKFRNGDVIYDKKEKKFCKILQIMKKDKHCLCTGYYEEFHEAFLSEENYEMRGNNLLSFEYMSNYCQYNPLEFMDTLGIIRDNDLDKGVAFRGG